MKTVLPRALSPAADSVSHDAYDADARMEPWQKTAFLEMLICGDSQHRAASKLGIPLMRVIRESSLDEQFSKDRALALSARVDALEELAIEFATRGTEEDVYHMGIPVGSKTNFGPHALLQFLLKGNKPERYKDRTEQTVLVTDTPPPAVRDDRDAKKLLALMHAELRPAIEGVCVEVKQTDDGSDLV